MALLISAAEPFMQFGQKGIMGNIYVNLFKWFRRCRLKKKFTDDGWMDELKHD